MVTFFKIAVLNHEDETARIYVNIQPRLPNFDSFKEALLSSIPAFKNEPLYMYYEDLVGDKVRLNNQSDFELLQKVYSHKTEALYIFVFVVKNPKDKQLFDILTNNHPLLPAAFTMSREQQAQETEAYLQRIKEEKKERRL